MAYQKLAHTYFIPGPVSEGTRIFSVSAAFGYCITSISYYTLAGTCQLKLKVGTTEIGGSSVTVNTTRQTSNCTPVNTVNENERVFLEITTSTDAEDLYIQASTDRL